MTAIRFFDALSGKMLPINITIGRGVERRAEAAALGGKPKYHPFAEPPRGVGLYAVRIVYRNDSPHDMSCGSTYYSVFDGKHWNGAWYTLSQAVELSQYFEQRGNQEAIDDWLADDDITMYWRDTLASDPS